MRVGDTGVVFIVKPHIANGFLPVRSVVFFFFFGHEREKTNSIEREREIGTT